MNSVAFKVKQKVKNTIERKIPIDSNNEQYILAVAMANKPALEMLVTETDHDHFLYVNHKVLYQCCKYLFENKIEVTPDSIDVVRKKFKRGETLRINYTTELLATFTEQFNETAYKFHLSKLKDDKVKDKLTMELIPNLEQMLTDTTISTDMILDQLGRIVASVEETTIDSDFKFIPLSQVDAEYNEEIKLREAGSSFGTTGYEKLDRYLTDGLSVSKMTIVAGRPGMGKCLKSLTKILMFDGSTKNVEDIEVGDIVMGPDSKPRRVLSLHSGREEMFDVIPNKGDTWGCNRNHVLSVRMSSDNGSQYKKGQIINLSVDEYLAKGTKFKHHAKQWRTGVEFSEQEVEYDPYLIGVWLGDGDRNTARITNPEPEIKDYLLSLQPRFNVTESKDSCSCPYFYLSDKQDPDNTISANLFFRYLKNNCIVDDCKIIPKKYLINDRKNRLQLLAGLIDTDGGLECGCYRITTKYDGLCEDILYLARSLGFAAYKKRKTATIKSIEFSGEYWCITISGNIEEIPCKVARKIPQADRQMNKDVLNVGFKLKSTGVGDYYGFTVDGDNLFLLGDFTVVHNSALVANVILRLGLIGIPCAIFNFEMDCISMYDRMVAIRANIPITNLIRDRDKLSQDEKIREEKAKEELKKLPVYFYTASTQTMAGIQRDIRLLKERYGVKVVAYDLFDKIRFNSNGNRSTADVLNDSLKMVQGFGRDFKIHQMLVVQIGRSAEKRKNKRPRLSELKDAGGFEERADNVFFLYRPSYYDSPDAEDEQEEVSVESAEEIEVIIAKQRQGVANVKVILDFWPATTTIAEPILTM